MDYQLAAAKYVRDLIVWVRFDDGIEGEIDFKPELYGPVFEPLLDTSQFRNFDIYPELRTLVWKNGADVSPEFLHEMARHTQSVPGQSARA